VAIGVFFGRLVRVLCQVIGGIAGLVLMIAPGVGIVLAELADGAVDRLVIRAASVGDVLITVIAGFEFRLGIADGGRAAIGVGRFRSQVARYAA
jgi:hypothetical protein